LLTLTFPFTLWIKKSQAPSRKIVQRAFPIPQAVSTSSYVWHLLDCGTNDRPKCCKKVLTLDQLSGDLHTVLPMHFRRTEGGSCLKPGQFPATEAVPCNRGSCLQLGQPREFWGTKGILVAFYVDPTGKLETGKFGQLPATGATACNRGNRLQPGQPPAAGATACSRGNCLRPGQPGQPPAMGATFCNGGNVGQPIEAAGQTSGERGSMKSGQEHEVRATA